MYKVVRIFEYKGGVKLEQEVLDGIAEVVEIPCTTEEDIIENTKDADAIIALYEPLTKRVLDSLPNLKVISYKSIGFNSVDLDHATELKIPVCHVTKYCTKEVADYVMSAILMANRRMFQFHNAVRYDRLWDFNLFPDTQRLESETVGLIGFGNIPKLVTERLKPFGCKVITYDPYVSEEVCKEYGVEKVELEELFKRADYISSHLPLNDETEKCINKRLFDLSKGNVVFINSSRGGVVNEKDLLEALDSGKIRFAILDVLEDENPDIENDKLANHKNVLLTPHIAFYSQQSAKEGQIGSAMNIKYFFDKEYDKMEVVNRVL